MQFMRTLLKAVVAEVLAIAALTETTTGTGIDIAAYDGTGMFILHSAAGTGTTPTMNVKLQHCDTVDGTYADITGATFTEVDDTEGGAIEAIYVDLSAAKRYIRAVATIAGTTPSFTCGVTFAGIAKGS